MNSTNYEFVVSVPLNFERKNELLYSSPAFIEDINSDTKSFSIIDSDKKIIIVEIHFQITNNQAISLINAPFGGFCFHCEINSFILSEFVKYIVNDLRKNLINEITINSPSSIYNKTQNLEATLLSLGFEKISNNINHHICINKSPFLDGLHTMEKRKIRKCVNSNFKFVVEPLTQIQKAYDFILACRIEKKQSLSMTIVQIEKAICKLPNNYLIFSIYDNDKIIACSISVIVNSSTIYNFYPASSLVSNKYSPMVFLISNMYAYCHENGYSIIDLGTSINDNIPNKGLIKFKERMNGLATSKPIYKLALRAG